MSGAFSYGSSRSRNYIDADQKAHLNNLWGNAGNLFASRQTMPGYDDPKKAGYIRDGYYTPPTGQNTGFNGGGSGLVPAQPDVTQLSSGLQTFGPQQEQPVWVGKEPGDPNVASFDPTQLAAQNYAINQAANFGDQSQGVNKAYDFALASPINPFTEQLVQTAARPVIQNLQENILPSIRGNSQSAGGYSSRTGIAEGIAGRGAIDTIGDMSTNMYNNAYNTGLNTMMGALNMAPQMAGYNMLPAEYLSQVGQQRQGQQQQVLDAPWLNIERYRDTIGGPHNVGNSRSKNYSVEASLF